jgi:hypothetical protein
VTKRKDPADKLPVGRPTKYRAEYAEEAARLCRLFGATDDQLGIYFGVSEKTINTWKDKHPEFLQSLNENKPLADAQVERALYRRALGYEHEAVKLFVVDGRIEEHAYTERYAPDPTSCIFWLKNRQPDRWRDKTTMEHEFGATVEAIITESWKH